MNGWIEWLALDEEAPEPQFGHGDSDVIGKNEDKNFRLDKKSGLFLPEAAYKQRRRIIGFQSSDE